MLFNEDSKIVVYFEQHWLKMSEISNISKFKIYQVQKLMKIFYKVFQLAI